MANLLENLRLGQGLTRSRIQAWAGMFLIGAICAGGWLAITAHGLNDIFGRPLGTDFSCFYAAGQLALQGKAETVYQLVPLHQEMMRLFGHAVPYEGWYYPPFFLMLMTALGTLPYIPALILWLGGSLLFYLLAMRLLASEFLPRISGRDRLFWLLTLAFPVVSLNFGYGQNGTLSAALMALGCAWLRRRPILAGICFGLMCYKPQLALLIPIVLAVGRYGRCWVSACITGLGTLLLPTLIWGTNIWPAFLQSLHVSQTLELQLGASGYAKNQSLFAALRHVGIGPETALMLHILLAVFLIAQTIRLWRKQQPQSRRLAVFLIGAMLINPHNMNYDLMLMAPAILLMCAEGLRRGFAPWEKSFLALLWLLPAASAAIAAVSYIPAGLILLLLAFFLLLRKATVQEIPQDMPAGHR